MESAFSDRLRGIVQGMRPRAVPVVAPDAAVADGPSAGSDVPSALGPSPPAVGQSPAPVRDARSGPRRSVADAAARLGGSVTERPDGSVIVVDREYSADAMHGRQHIGDLVQTILGGQDAMATLRRAWPSPPGAGISRQPPDGASRLLFLDLETTGLAGGAGTQAFLVGCAWIEGASIRLRQFLLPGFEHERALLSEVATWAQTHGTLVTFNGRTFDVPLIETRYLFHRVAFPLDGVPHLDMLHPARRLWQWRPSIAGPDPDEGSCSLSVLERHLAGVRRVGDVPGFEIPSRYFQFVRDGCAEPLEAVLEHNRLDLISTAVVMARALRLIEGGPAAASSPHECHGLARLYERAGAPADAEASYVHAIDRASRLGHAPELQADALRRLAWCRRRSGRPIEAAETWQQLASLPRCPATLRREAREALAIHHEHRSHDLDAARALVLDVLHEDAPGRRRGDAEHRLRRLERKLAAREPGRLLEDQA